MILVKGGKADFIQDHQDGVGSTVMGFFSGGQKLSSTLNEYSVSKWELIAEEQGGGQWMENYQEETSG